MTLQSITPMFPVSNESFPGIATRLLTLNNAYWVPLR